jgi:thiol-disulfide isomerase/thioredoxin
LPWNISEYGGGGILRNKNILAVAPLLILTAFFSVRCIRPPSGAGEAEIGRKAPDFRLRDLSGHEVSLGQYRGKIVILDFWAEWCGPCRMSMPILEQLQEEYSGKMTLLAVNLRDSEEVVRNYVQSQNLSSKVILDPDGAVGQQYGAVGIPMQFIIDREGVVRYVLSGYDPRMKSWIKSEIDKLL